MHMLDLIKLDFDGNQVRKITLDEVPEREIRDRLQDFSWCTNRKICQLYICYTMVQSSQNWQKAVYKL